MTLRCCSSRVNTLPFISACIAVSYPCGYTIHNTFFNKHGVEEPVGDGDYTSVATSLRSKSLGYGKLAPGSSPRASPAPKLLGAEPGSF